MQSRNFWFSSHNCVTINPTSFLLLKFNKTIKVKNQTTSLNFQLRLFNKKSRMILQRNEAKLFYDIRLMAKDILRNLSDALH